VTLQIRAIGPTATVDELVAVIQASDLKMTRLHRGLTAREPGAELAYLDVHIATNTATTTVDDTTRSAA
jgi:hypothetical protein